jgi:glycyl-tRNA synthetase
LQLEAAVPLFLMAKRLQYSSVSVHGTPRRLVVLIKQLVVRQEDSEREVRGPPASKAFDAEGKPTKAAEGFCRKNGVQLGDMFVKTDGKTEYVFAVVKEQGKQSVQVRIQHSATATLDNVLTS